MMQPEAKFKTKLVEGFQQVHPLGWFAYLRALGKDGVPDLRFVIPGLGGVWVEAKAEEKPYSPAQRLQMRRLFAAGERVIGVRCRGLDQIPGRTISIEFPHRDDVDVRMKFSWADRASSRFWTNLFNCGGL